MLLKNKKILVKWNNANKEHYISKGYSFTKIKDEFEIYPNDLPRYSGEKVWVQCDYCGKIYNPIYKNYMNNHKDNKDCCPSCKYEKAKETTKERYGVEYYSQTKESKNKIKNTCFIKYGVSNPSKVKEFQNKKISTNLKKFNSEWFVNSDPFKESCMKKYGEDNPMKSINVQIKATQTLIKNNNVPISKQEKEMIKILKDMYGEENCIPSYQFNRMTLDCLLLINNNKIDIEYDGYYWHKNRKHYDRKRDEFLKKEGFKILRIISKNKIPTKEQIKEAIDYLCIENNKFSKINIDM